MEEGTYFICTTVIECSSCEWKGRPMEQGILYGKQYKRGYVMVCPKCKSENISSFEDEEFKHLPEKKTPILGG